MEELMKGRIDEERKKNMEHVRKDTEEQSILKIKTRIKEKQEADAAAKEEGREFLFFLEIGSTSEVTLWYKCCSI